MPLDLTETQRLAVLCFVRENSPTEKPFYLDKIPGLPERIAGADLGWALLTLDEEGLCGVEEPDIVWSTPEGLAAVSHLKPNPFIIGGIDPRLVKHL
jgi:hypothetical protein